jgi:hypothetical protein
MDIKKPVSELSPEEMARLAAKLERALAEAEREIEAGEMLDGPTVMEELRRHIAERAGAKRKSARRKRAR